MEENNNEIKKQENSAIQVIEKTENSEKKNDEIKINTLEKDTEENKQTTSKTNKKSKQGIILIITVIILILIALFSTIFAIINIGNEKIIKGIKIAQIDISNLTKEEAQKTLEEIYLKKMDNEIYLKYGEFESTTTYKALEVEYQINDAIEKAYEIGRDGNLLKDNLSIIKSWTKGNQLELDVTIDKEMLEQVVQNINNSIEGAVVQPSYYIEDQKLIITSGKEGLKVESNQLFEEIYKAVKDDNQDYLLINTSKR